MIGTHYAFMNQTLIGRLLTKHLGTPDVHSHYRTNPLFKFLKSTSIHTGSIIVEIGCGAGQNIFAINDQLDGKDVSFYGFDLNSSSIETAELTRSNLQHTNIQFLNQDCSRFDFSNKVNVVLMIDLLEHLEDPKILLSDIGRLIDTNGYLLISVPTPKYPRVFGEEFHRQVGHKWDGITISQLTEMLEKTGFRVDHVSYNTGLIASFICHIYYQTFYGLKGRKKIILGYFLSCLMTFDYFNGADKSCSLFVVARPK
jgi:2-polyprenyl-3-methyl-5-hydroxy-6-metoxy-1,4-benzoquinol methylase